MSGYEMPPDASLAGYELRVRDLEASVRFYTDVLGLHADRREDELLLAPSGGGFTVRLTHDPGAPIRPYPSVGLYHCAMLVPDRPALGSILRRLLEIGWPLEGAADHGVSEAVYLRDPENNGIELYRDRPRDEWPREQDQVAMYSRRLDDEGILGEAPASGPLHPDTQLGHVHLHVPDIEGAERFYADGLGLRVTQRTLPGALFLAAGDYHHHLGTNVWARGRTAPPEATGLVRYTWTVPDLASLETHMSSSPLDPRRTDTDLRVTDPAGVEVVLRSA
ncbi:MAG TPA: VOC family protein [Actinomycetota bacterium]|nr:VOC family protein [Actinomycetota bacterium]